MLRKKYENLRVRLFQLEDKGLTAKMGEAAVLALRGKMAKGTQMLKD